MLFKPEFCEAIKKRLKTQTRRLVKPDEELRFFNWWGTDWAVPGVSEPGGAWTRPTVIMVGQAALDDG